LVLIQQDLPQFGRQADQPLGAIGAGEDKARAAVGQHVRQRRVAQLRMHRQHRAAGADDRQRRRDPGRAFGRKQRHGVAACEARFDKPARQRFDAAGEFGIGLG